MTNVLKKIRSLISSQANIIWICLIFFVVWLGIEAWAVVNELKDKPIYRDYTVCLADAQAYLAIKALNGCFIT